MSSPVSLVEVFSGIQGEGAYVGLRQLFVRLALCNLRCEYCDTAHSWTEPDFFSLESFAGSRIFETHANPLSPDAVMSALDRFDPSSHHSLVLTGGEPLLCEPFLQDLLPRLRQKGWKIFLETNGTLSQQLTAIAHMIDIVSLDIKLPVASINTDFLAAAAAARDRYGPLLQAKIVITADTAADGLLAAVSAASLHDIPVVLQPVNPAPHHTLLPPSPQRLLELQADALTVFSDVRIIPQVHRLMGQL